MFGMHVIVRFIVLVYLVAISYVGYSQSSVLVSGCEIAKVTHFVINEREAIRIMQLERSAEAKKYLGYKYVVINATYKSRKKEMMLFTPGVLRIGKSVIDEATFFSQRGANLFLVLDNYGTVNTNLMFRIRTSLSGDCYWYPNGASDTKHKIYIGRID